MVGLLIFDTQQRVIITNIFFIVVLFLARSCEYYNEFCMYTLTELVYLYTLTILTLIHICLKSC